MCFASELLRSKRIHCGKKSTGLYTFFRMLTRICSPLCAVLICLASNAAQGQTSLTELQNFLTQKSAFEATDFAALDRNETVVRLGPVSDKREVAVLGMVNIRAGADEFLRSYREGMTRKNNAAILEIGAFGKEPAVTDLQNLSIDVQDIEDLKACVVGDCQLKLSAPMIERFRREIDWNGPDYSTSVSNLYKQMLLEYVRDYRARGEKALIQYNDKRDEISLAAEQQTLRAAASYVKAVLAEQRSELRLVEDAIVWSKIKFGLKPVIAINHVSIYRRDREVGPQVVVASNQIYANHYFNAFQSLTAFVTVPDATQGSYLVYENRSRADGLEGPFSKIKRGVIEKKAVEGLKAILAQSKAGLDGRATSAVTAEFSAHQPQGWRHRLFGGVRPLLWFVMLAALVALLLAGRISIVRRKLLKPESARS